MDADATTPKTALRELLASQPRSVVAAALARRTTLPGDPSVPPPAAGQCWLLRWDDLLALVVLTRVREDHLLVMPLEVNPATADETALVVPTGDEGFSHDVAVFAMLETGVGPWVLDSFVATLGPEPVADSLRRWMRTGDSASLPAGWREGAATGHDAHPRRIARQALAERIATLGEAEWVPQSWSRREGVAADASLATDQEANAPALDVPAMLRVLGGPPQRVFGIARGTVEPSSAEVEQLAAAGIIIGGVRQPPTDVIRDLDSPALKAAVTALAQRRAMPEGETRRALARENMALAARTVTGQDVSLSPSVRMLREAMRRELEEQPQ